MKILFIENRGKTYIYNSVAKELEKLGHEICWIIYNHAIKVDCGSINQIPYPDKKDMVEHAKVLEEDRFEQVSKSDRYFLYYRRDLSHYPYYWSQLEQVISQEQPDVVFGEISTFYAIMVSMICKDKAIPMFTEAGARYPRGRFIFSLPLTYRQLSDSGETIDFDVAKLKWEKIAQRATAPDYMDRLKFNFKTRLVVYLRSARQRIQFYLEYLKGEKYYIRTLTDTFMDFAKPRIFIWKWNRYAESTIRPDDKFNIIFPLQLQPEFNLDVWGNKYRNQADTIKAISRNLPGTAVLYVKLNPVTSLEATTELLTVCTKTDNVRMLHSDTNMNDIFADIDMAITATGTISIEAVFSDLPVIILCEGTAGLFKGCVHVRDISEITEHIEKTMAGKFTLADDDEKYRFYSYLLRYSHAGLAQDFTRSYAGKPAPANLGLLVTAYTKLLEQLDLNLLEYAGKPESKSG